MTLLELLFPTKRLPLLDELVVNYWAIELGDPNGIEKARLERLHKSI